MPEQYILSGVLLLFLIAEKVHHILAARSWARDRRDLCNRLQAGSLADYAQHKAVVEAPVAGDTRPQTPQGGYDGELAGIYSSFEETELSAGQLASVQAMSERVLEG